ncbi:TEA-domain-containing protein [Lindgomyces ingoldianus]|uniref:TEA-domain-containing protein n=1 Tax=Lindgomyces ingoldianus TaxID=673940 RepID=A0ACB6RA43_9PLEO|nr:TEA-domain-containing protein [Lindgomyces ingoldianus]KAF2476143.1 TEA-domain-containing protein [Lindgomyces ingoldianus]
MELHSVLPSNAPALPPTPLPESAIPSRVLQERSGNRGNTYTDDSNVWKSSFPPVENFYSHNVGGDFFAEGIAAHLCDEKSEEQINHETAKLWRLLEQSEKYRKYRARQPKTKKEREQKWPDNLEHAFFRGLVRWAPMGRRKLMIEGEFRGRNELVADSIRKDTGIRRTRKQVSSHIQVLKSILSDMPRVLVHMSTEDLGRKTHRHSAGHPGHLRNRHGLKPSSYDHTTPPSMNPWQGYCPLPSSQMVGRSADHTYGLTNFAMFVQDASKRPVHYYTRLAENSRLEDLNVTDMGSWNQQYPELAFHGTEQLRDRQIIVCDTSIKIMTDKPPQDSELSVQFDVTSPHDLSAFEPLQSRTRFYDSGELADQIDVGAVKKETHCDCEYDAETGRVRMKFGSRFWVGRMSRFSRECRDSRMLDEKNARMRVDINVRRPLQCMTAVQDLYGVARSTGISMCFLTILWRFHQTRSTCELGTTNWRIARFPSPEQRWVKTEGIGTAKDIKGLMDSTSSPPGSVYSSLPLRFPNQPFSQHPHQLDLESLSTIALEGIGDYPHSATAPSMATDYLQTHSLPGLHHAQGTAVSQSQGFHSTNDIDFTSEHINLCLEPAIHLDAYENYGSRAPSLNPLNSIVSLEHSHTDNSFNDISLSVTTSTCYPTKPWPYPDLIEKLEGVAEQTHRSVFDHGTRFRDIARHSVLHDGQVANGMWKLQSSSHEDTAMADARIIEEPMSQEGTEEHGMGVVGLIDREQRTREGKYQPY